MPGAYTETRTDASGAFTVTVTAAPDILERANRRAQHYQVIAANEDHALGWALVLEGELAALQLRAQPVTCAGTVTDRLGKALPGVTVTVTWLRHVDTDWLDRLSLKDSDLLSAATDAAGRFEISGLPKGNLLSLRTTAEGMVVLQRAGYVATDAQDVVVVLQPAASISGRITRDGQPVADVQIRAQGGHSISHKDSDAAGEFRFDGLLPGTYNVLTRAPEGYTAVAVANIRLEAGDYRQGLELELIEGGFVEGTVTAVETGQPMAGVRIRAHGPADPSEGGTLLGTSTDEAGRYRLRLPPGNNTVNVGLGGKDYEPVEPGKLAVEIVAGKTTAGIDFEVTKPKSIEGIVRGPDGAPWPAGRATAAVSARRLLHSDGTRRLAALNDSRPPWLPRRCPRDPRLRPHQPLVNQPSYRVLRAIQYPPPIEIVPQRS